MERIHVSVRARPLSAEDAKTSPWRISGNSISTVNQSANFVYDRIFGEECKTREVYEDKTKQLVAAAVAGFNGTVFAYGQTNSGKTHTMRGSVSEPGVIPLAVRELFDIIQEDVDREFLLRMSYMEIYNEEINDLLVPEHRKLQIHESLERGIFVAGLREEIVTCSEQVLNFMEFGEIHRHIGETNMNVYSSRSHTIFRMIIESRDRVEDGDPGNICDAVRVSVLNLVDLAGSERAAKTGAEGVRLKEGSHINKSLMTLGTVINKLSEGVDSHVPYRDSKLTRILQPSLGGNANTAIICNITLAQIHADETKSSLQFASRALRVTNCAHVNEILTDAALLKRQKKEIEELRAKLLDSNSDHFEEEILNLRNTLLQSELEKERIALELQAEKKAQAQRDRRLQEQAKKIANLSFMILNTKKDDTDDEKQQKMRRKTWCPTPLSMESPDAVLPIVQDTNRESAKAERDIALNLSFDELVDESNDDCPINERTIPDASLRNITKRRKVPSKEKSSISVNLDLTDMQAEYEKLLQKFETELTTKDIEIECLKKGLARSEQYADMSTVPHLQNCPNAPPGIKSLTSRESKAIYVIKQLEEQIETLEREKSSVQATLDSVVELATEQNRSASEKFDKVHQELLDAREEARLVTEQLCCFTSSDVSEKLKSCEAESLSLSKDLYEVRHEMECCRERCKVLSEKLSLSEENAEREKKCSMEKAMEIARLTNIFKELENERHKYQEVQNSEVLNLKTKQELLHAENEKLKKDAVENNKEKARLSLILRSSQAKLEAATGRYRETVEDRELMHEKFKLASKELKEELETIVKENLHLKKLLSHH